MHGIAPPCAAAINSLIETAEFNGLDPEPLHRAVELSGQSIPSPSRMDRRTLRTGLAEQGIHQRDEGLAKTERGSR